MACNSKLVLFITLWLPLSLTAVYAKYNFRTRCESFTPEAYAFNSTRHVVAYLPLGTNLSLPDNDPSCERPNQTIAADLCRIGLSIPTSNRSSVSLELWLPEEWNDRFLATGNGGIDGCRYPRLLREMMQFKPLILTN